MSDSFRIERDLLGDLPVLSGALYGIHTVRALENFPLAGRPVHPELGRVYGTVKLACALTNRSLGVWTDAKAGAIERACRELSDGLLGEHIVVDALQGGAGTSTNMNVNEVLANRALQFLGLAHGAYDSVSPLDDINLHQSTNDTYPTALKLAAIRGLQRLEQSVVALQEAFQDAEKRFAHVVKVGRTQLQDAVLTTVGREMSAYAEAMTRDRWRIYKCQERLRVVNLGGTAIGTGLAAPRQFIFQAVENLRDLTGIGFARAENLVEATQNADVFVEVSGILKAHAVSLFKICSDLRLLASGPDAGLGEIRLPARQAGSSIMPGKVNPVIPEAVSQAAMLVMSHDTAIAMACASGSLELNPFLPLVAACLLETVDLLARADDILRRHCLEDLEVDEERCRRHVENSTAAATALLPALGYERACEAARRASEQGRSVRDIVISLGWVAAGEFDALTSPEAVCRLGTPEFVTPKADATLDTAVAGGGEKEAVTLAPKGLRLHIALFGRRNVGKSSLLNAITRQQVSIVSPVAGTTTDPVEKPMELLPIGPVLFIDTAGVDDTGELGALRVQKTRQVLDRTDVAILVTEAAGWGSFEEEILSELSTRRTPTVVVFNKIDCAPLATGEGADAVTARLSALKLRVVRTSAVLRTGILDLRQALLDLAPPDFIDSPALVGDLAGPGEMVVLVVPIDKEAPKGRLILPQVQAIRDLLDSDSCCLVVKERELRNALDRLKEPPKLVVTDSQAFLKVAADTPRGVPLTSFSILMARFKGHLLTQVLGTLAVEKLRRDDRVLIAEACSHHPIGEDIGRVKIPRWLTQYTGAKLQFDHVQGHDFPEDLSPYKLVIHCGACMWNRREMLSRILRCQQAGVPITNYGLTIAYSLGIFERALEPFPAALEAWSSRTEKPT